jgi:hypothetical protein
LGLLQNPCAFRSGWNPTLQCPATGGTTSTSSAFRSEWNPTLQCPATGGTTSASSAGVLQEQEARPPALGTRHLRMPRPGCGHPGFHGGRSRHVRNAPCLTGVSLGAGHPGSPERRQSPLAFWGPTPWTLRGARQAARPNEQGPYWPPRDAEFARRAAARDHAPARRPQGQKPGREEVRLFACGPDECYHNRTSDNMLARKEHERWSEPKSN